VNLERFRISALTIAARCRVGELTLARGDPEEAMHEATAALRVDRVNQRAARLFIRCQLAVGSASTARQFARAFSADVHADGQQPDAETETLIARIRLHHPKVAASDSAPVAT
jgi:hypothetical protein